MKTLQEAVDEVLAGREKGIECPCCGQLAKVYRRKLNSAMAYVLVVLMRRAVTHPQEKWVHVPSLLNGHGSAARGGDWAKLWWWGLLQPRPGRRRDGSRRTGYWRLTTDGVDFASERIEVPRYVYIYNGEALDRDDDSWIDIHDALGERFNYDELMHG